MQSSQYEQGEMLLGNTHSYTHICFRLVGILLISFYPTSLPSLLFCCHFYLTSVCKHHHAYQTQWNFPSSIHEQINCVCNNCFRVLFLVLFISRSVPSNKSGQREGKSEAASSCLSNLFHSGRTVRHLGYITTIIVNDNLKWYIVPTSD